MIGTDFLKLRFNPNIKYKALSNYKNIITNILHNTEISTQFYSQVQYNGTEYKKENYLAVFNNDVLFHKLLEIVVVEEKTLLFFCQKLRNVNFDPHFIAYVLDDPYEFGSFSLISPDQILGPPISVIKTAKGKHVLRLKEYYKMI